MSDVRIERVEVGGVMNGIQRIAAERQRQIDVEGWTAEHDAKKRDGILTAAGICYAQHALGDFTNVDFSDDGDGGPPYDWPWDNEWWKPSDDPIRNLEKAGALFAAEIDRLLRISDD